MGFTEILQGFGDFVDAGFQMLIRRPSSKLRASGELPQNVPRNVSEKNNAAPFKRRTQKFLCLSSASLEIFVSSSSAEWCSIYFSGKIYRRFGAIPPLARQTASLRAPHY